MKKGKTIFMAIACLLFAGSGFAQDIEYVGSTLWTEVSGVKVARDYAYCAFTNGLGVLDISNPDSPSLAGSLYLQNGIIEIDIFGDYAYVVDGDALRVIDVSDPHNPVYAGSYDTPGYAFDVFIHNNYAFVADAESGLQVINVFDPANLYYVGSCDTPGRACGAYSSGNNIYVADWSSLRIIGFTLTEIQDGEDLPDIFFLAQNYPNPFNTQTTIQYTLPTQSEVSIDIFDILGRKVETIAEGIMPAGEDKAT